MRVRRRRWRPPGPDPAADVSLEVLRTERDHLYIVTRVVTAALSAAVDRFLSDPDQEDSMDADLPEITSEEEDDLRATVEELRGALLQVVGAYEVNSRLERGAQEHARQAVRVLQDSVDAAAKLATETEAKRRRALRVAVAAGLVVTVILGGLGYLSKRQHDTSRAQAAAAQATLDDQLARSESAYGSCTQRNAAALANSTLFRDVATFVAGLAAVDGRNNNPVAPQRLTVEQQFLDELRPFLTDAQAPLPDCTVYLRAAAGQRARGAHEAPATPTPAPTASATQRSTP